MKIMKKFLATFLAISLLSSLCFNASAATTITENAFIGADATTQTLEYAYEAFVGKNHDGTDYDYGSFESKKDATNISNTTQNFGLKGVFGWKVKSGATGVQAQTDVDSHSGKYAMKFTNVETNAESVLMLYPSIGGKATDKYSGDITGLVPYANYQFVFWYKGNKTLKVHYHTVVENQDTEIVSSYTAMDEWKQASINIMANASGIIKLWLDFGETVSTGQYVLLDDVAFYRCGVATNGSINLFGDDGLESTVTGDFTFKSTKSNWMEIKDAAGNYTHFARSGDDPDNGTTFTMGVSEDTAHSGKKSLKIESAASANSYLLRLRPQYVYYAYSKAKCIPAENGDYTLSFWIKGNPDIYGLNVDAGDTTPVQYKFSNFKSNMENVSAKEWRQVTVKDIPVTDGDIYVDINVILYGTNQGATEITPLYIDDIQLVKQVEEAPVERGDNYVENGDFEDGEIGATSVKGFAYDEKDFANNTIEITDDAIFGEKAIKITQNANGDVAYGGAFYAEGTFASESYITDVPAGDYLVSVWTKGAAKPKFYYAGSTAVDVGEDESWTLNVKTATVSDTVAPRIQFNFRGTAAYINTSLYIDDIRYETVDTAVARITAMLEEFDVATATAQEIEYLLQWVHYLAREGHIEQKTADMFKISVGDVTCNGKFNEGDMANIRSYLLGEIEANVGGFDINLDGNADIRDLVRAVSIPRV